MAIWTNDDFHQEAFCLAEALACLFHVLLFQKIGMPLDVLTKLMAKSMIAERLIKPSLGEVGLEIASDKA